MHCYLQIKYHKTCAVRGVFLISHPMACSIAIALPADAVLTVSSNPEISDKIMLTPEDYLQGVIGVINELVRPFHAPAISLRHRK